MPLYLLKKKLFVFVFGIILMPNHVWPQVQFRNPFFNEANFFISGYERAVFSKVETGEPVNNFPLFLSLNSTDTEEKVKRMEELLDEFYSQLSFKNHQSESAKLKKIFTAVHKRFLKKYQRYASFERLTDDGSYDCLTGTALYAIVLDHFNYKYTIHETALHSYLIVHASSAEVLFESTDPLGGYVDDKSIIDEMESRYSKEMEPAFNNVSGLTGYKASSATIRYFNEEITIAQLAGLQYFNQAVISYNLENYRNAVRYLEKSFAIYPCKRIALLLLNSIQKVLNDPTLSRKDLRIYSGKTSFYTKGSEKFFN